MAQSHESRGRGALAYQWASRTISICVGMVVPGLVGYFVDVKLNTLPAMTLIGFLVGMLLGMWRLIRFARQLQSTAADPDSEASRAP